MKKILFYSNNKNKQKEIKRLLKPLSLKVFSPKDFYTDYEPKENGSSFTENAKIKSSFGFNKFNIPCFADDSGICIEALDWGPGIFSKKFIESFDNYNECFRYVFDRIKVTKKNNAYFKTSVCLTLEKDYHIVFEGTIKGTISKTIKGSNGFGYDPIFTPDGISKTFAEMNSINKNKYSHRSIAINKLINFLSI